MLKIDLSYQTTQSLSYQYFDTNYRIELLLWISCRTYISIAQGSQTNLLDLLASKSLSHQGATNDNDIIIGQGSAAHSTDVIISPLLWPHATLFLSGVLPLLKKLTPFLFSVSKILTHAHPHPLSFLFLLRKSTLPPGAGAISLAPSEAYHPNT